MDNGKFNNGSGLKERILVKEKEFKSGLMDLNMKGYGNKTKPMEKGDSFTQMEMSTLESGKMVIDMVNRVYFK